MNFPVYAFKLYLWMFKEKIFGSYSTDDLCIVPWLLNWITHYFHERREGGTFRLYVTWHLRSLNTQSEFVFYLKLYRKHTAIVFYYLISTDQIRYSTLEHVTYIQSSKWRKLRQYYLHQSQVYNFNGVFLKYSCCVLLCTVALVIMRRDEMLWVLD